MGTIVSASSNSAAGQLSSPAEQEEEEEEKEEEEKEEEEKRSSRAFAFVGLASVRRAKHTHVEKPSPGNEDAAWAGARAVSPVHVDRAC